MSNKYALSKSTPIFKDINPMILALHDYSFLASVNGFPQDVISFQTILWDDVVENPGEPLISLLLNFK